jgi:hypothetical protein
MPKKQASRKEIPGVRWWFFQELFYDLHLGV